MARRLAELRRRHPDARWIPESKLHCTVVFLGATPETGMPDVIQAMESAVDRSSLSRLTLGAADGTHRRSGSAVAWLSVTEGADQVRDLAIDLDQRLRAAGCPPAAGPVAGTRAHVTVARRVPPSLLAEMRAVGHVGPSWGVTELVLFTSVPGWDGSVYEPVHRAALDGR